MSKLPFLLTRLPAKIGRAIFLPTIAFVNSCFSRVSAFFSLSGKLEMEKTRKCHSLLHKILFPLHQLMLAYYGNFCGWEIKCKSAIYPDYLVVYGLHSFNIKNLPDSDLAVVELTFDDCLQLIADPVVSGFTWTGIPGGIRFFLLDRPI